MRPWLLGLLLAMNGAELVGTALLDLRLRRLLLNVHAELTPNHGTSTRDAVDRLEATVNRLEMASEQAAVAFVTAQQTADLLKTTMSIATEVAVQNRAQLVELTGAVADAASGAAVVADDLAASHDRANGVDGGEPGAAADAASQSPRVR